MNEHRESLDTLEEKVESLERENYLLRQLLTEVTEERNVAIFANFRLKAALREIPPFLELCVKGGR